MYEYLQQATIEQLRLGSFGIVAIVVSIMLFYVALPQWRAYGSARILVTTLEQGMADGIDLDAQLGVLAVDVEKLEHTLHGDTSNLPLKQVEAFVIGRLQTISWKNHVELVGVKPHAGTQKGPFRELLFDLELRGDYFDCFAWLQDISSELGFIVVKQFEMSPIAGDGDEPLLRVKLTMASYRNAET
jgi:hypothetical protein